MHVLPYSKYIHQPIHPSLLGTHKSPCDATPSAIMSSSTVPPHAKSSAHIPSPPVRRPTFTHTHSLTHSLTRLKGRHRDLRPNPDGQTASGHRCSAPALCKQPANHAIKNLSCSSTEGPKNGYAHTSCPTNSSDCRSEIPKQRPYTTIRERTSRVQQQGRTQRELMQNHGNLQSQKLACRTCCIHTLMPA